MKQLMLLGVFLLSMLSASAYDFEVDGIYYNVVSASERTCEVTSAPEEYVGEVVIPDSVTYMNRKLTVVRIGNKAFDRCRKLTGVVIPNSVTTIGQMAFYMCSGLTTINIPNSVTVMEPCCFGWCTALTSVKIPTLVNEIPVDAFYYCSELTSVEIPTSVTNIDNQAFAGCERLKSVNLPNELSNIGYNAFSSCKSLESIVIPQSVTNIEDYAFRGCKSLTSVTLSSSINKIADGTFSFCSNLESINIPASVKTIEGKAFSNCEKLTHVVFEPSVENLILKSPCFDERVTSVSVGRPLSNYTYSDNVWVGVFERVTYPYNPYATNLIHISHLTLLDGIDVKDMFYNNLNGLSELDTLMIGQNVVGLGVSSTNNQVSLENYSKLSTIICQDPTPTASCPIFSNFQYTSVMVYVPKGSLSAYQNADGWKNFWNIVEMEESGIDSIADDAEKVEIGRYNLQGRRITEDYKGIVIVKYSDGTAKKIISDGSAR